MRLFTGFYGLILLQIYSFLWHSCDSIYWILFFVGGFLQMSMMYFYIQRPVLMFPSLSEDRSLSDRENKLYEQHVEVLFVLTDRPLAVGNYFGC